MAVTKDVEDIGLLALLAVLGLLFFVAFRNKLNAASGDIGSQVANGLQTGLLSAGSALGIGAGSAVTSAGTGLIDGIGNTFGDWIWNGVTSLFPSLLNTGPDYSELNTANVAQYPGDISQMVPSGFPNVPVNPSSW